MSSFLWSGLVVSYARKSDLIFFFYGVDRYNSRVQINRRKVRNALIVVEGMIQ